MLTVLAAIEQLERKTIRERQAEGIATAKRNGAYDRVPSTRFRTGKPPAPAISAAPQGWGF